MVSTEPDLPTSGQTKTRRPLGIQVVNKCSTDKSVLDSRALTAGCVFFDQVTTASTVPETLPEAPTQEPETEPRPLPSAPPERAPNLDPFNPDWPDDRPEPQPKA